MERKKKSEKRKRLLILTIVTITLIFSGYLLFNYSTIVDIKELKMYITVGEIVGFNVGTEAVFFGTIQRGGSGNRDLIVTNNYTFPVKIDIRAYGELAKWVYVSENGFLLQPNENKTVKVSLIVPKDANFGNYTGILKVNFRKF